MRRSDKDFVDQFYDHGLYVPTRTIDIMCEINEETANKVIKALHVLDHTSTIETKPITIILNSTGGTQDDGLAIYDAISECKNHVTIKAYGSVMSTAAWIMQAGDLRVMSKNCKMMLHTGQIDMGNEHPEQHKRWLQQFQKDELIFEEILLNKIKIKKPRFTKKQVRDMLKFDTILTAQDAFEYNLIDEII